MSWMLIPFVEVVSIQLIGIGILKALATVHIAGQMLIHDIRIIQEEGRPARVAMPAYKSPFEDSGKSIIEIVDGRLKQQISEAVITAWKEQSR